MSHVPGSSAELPRLLFLCTGNSCRSQMAEGWARALKGNQLAVFSAGLAPGGLDPRAVAVMREAGVDISGQTSQHLDELRGEDFAWVVTVCSDADARCPVFPGATRRVHRPFPDPPRRAAGLAPDAALGVYREVRDAIRAYVETLPAALPDQEDLSRQS